MIKQIKKRNGQLVDFDANKLNKWATWASDINGVEWASVALDAVKKCHDRCTTSELQKAMISACIDKEDESHLYMAGRLYSAECYKEVFGSFKNIPTLKEMYHTMTKANLWQNMNYSDSELDIIGDAINHDLDLTYPYNQLFQIKNKYALTNRATGKCYETPQFTFMRVALGSMAIQPKSTRVSDVISVYKYLSSGKINAPTPYMLYFGTGHLGLASCCVYVSKDDIPSISAGDHIAYMMTCASAGIGSAMLTRSKGDPVRNGTIKHLGKLPYYKVVESNVCANKQAGRGGACTMHFNCLDPEIEDLLRLRHPKTVDDKKIKNIDYSLVYNKLFLQKAAKNEDWMLISYFHAKDLWEAMYSDDLDKFTEKYNYYLSIDVPKRMVNARDIAKLFLVNSYEVGRIYEFAADNANSHTPFNDTIYSSNLCVAPETMILTNQGYVQIGLLKNQKVDIWNGHNWATVDVIKTGTDQKLIDITTDSGQCISCTPYHKFYIFDGYNKPYKEIRAHELKPGDALCKFELPVVDGQLELENAYINGFYSGDGCLTPQGQRIYLYHDKIKLANQFPGGSDWTVQENLNRQYKHYTNLKDKFFVPTAFYSVKSRLNWLAGYLDADGCVYNNGLNQQLTATSVELEFLKEVQLMLQTLGVSSKIKVFADEGFKLLSKNDGSGELYNCWCKKSYRLLIASNGTYKLLQLGLNLNRLKISSRMPQREAERFIKITSVVDNGRVDDTYCFTEPDSGKGMFNGILTGQCQEIMLPTKSFDGVQDLYKWHSDGEIALCHLMAICAGRVSEEEYEDVAYYALLMADNAISIMDYPFESLATSATSRRSVGVGITNLAYSMALNNLRYDSVEGKNYMHRLAEMHAYYLYKASLRLAKEKGNARWMLKTKYPNGWLPIDTYNKNVDLVHTQPLLYDWETLRKQIIDNGGIRNSTVCAMMPCESSSLASNTTNGLYPIRNGVVIKIDEDSKKVFIAPGWEYLSDNYQIAFDIKDPDMTDTYAIFQKFTDQGISADFYKKYTKDDNAVSFKDIFQSWLYRHKMGLKSRYYINSASGVDVSSSTIKESEEQKGCDGGFCTL